MEYNSAMQKRHCVGHPPRLKPHPNLTAIFLIFLFSLVYFLPYLRFDKTMVPYDLMSHIQPWAAQGSISYQNIMMGDVILQFAPWHVLYRNAWLSGEIPFWNPYSAGGTPFLANHMSGIFYPFNLIFLFLPLDTGFTVFGLLHKFITGLGMFFLLRRLGLHPFSGLMGALTWMYSGYLTVWLPWLPVTATLTWLPWAVLLVEMIIAEGKWRNVGWFALVVALIFFGGHIQFVYYSYLTLASFVIWRTVTGSFPVKEWLQRLLKIGIGSALGLAVAAIQLLPTLELSQEVVRGTTTIQALIAAAVPKNDWPTLLVPEALGNVNDYLGSGNFVEFTGYIGILGLALIAAAALFPRWKARKDLWFFPLLALAAICLVYGGSLNLLMQYVPGYTLFRTVVRFYAIWTFAAAVLVAIGVETFLSARNWRFRGLLLLGAGITLAGVLSLWKARSVMRAILRTAGLPFASHLSSFRWAFVLLILAGLAMLCLLAASRQESWRRALLLCAPLLVVSVDMLRLSRDYLPVVDSSRAFLSAPSIEFLQQHSQDGRIARYRSGFLGSPLSPNIGIVYGLEDIDAYDSFSVRRYSQLVGAIEPARYEDTLLYNQMYGFENPDVLGSPILQILRVAYLLSEKPIPELAAGSNTLSSQNWTQVYSGPDMVIYQNQRVLPLAGIYNKYRVEGDESRQIKILSNGSFDPSDQVLLSEAPQGEIDPKATGVVKILRRTFNTLEIQVSVSAKVGKSAILLVAENNYPGWGAQIDGREAALASADDILQALVIPAGDHIVRLSFLPSHFVSGMLISLAALGVILILFIIPIRKS
jgi:hypothetical protein